MLGIVWECASNAKLFRPDPLHAWSVATGSWLCDGVTSANADPDLAPVNWIVGVPPTRRSSNLNAIVPHGNVSAPLPLAMPAVQDMSSPDDVSAKVTGVLSSLCACPARSVKSPLQG